jgi:hypothetical protein
LAPQSRRRQYITTTSAVAARAAQQGGQWRLRRAPVAAQKRGVL